MNDLKDLKVGDSVCLVGHRGFGSNHPHFILRGKVEKITETQITAFNGRRYLLNSGREVGGSYGRFSNPPRLRPETAELIKSVELGERIAEAESTCFQVSERLRRAEDEDALMLVALISDELKATVKK